MRRDHSFHHRDGDVRGGTRKGSSGEQKSRTHIGIPLDLLPAHDHGRVVGEASRVLLVGGGVVGDFVEFAEEGRDVPVDGWRG